MEYTNHIILASDAQEIADAVDSGTLVKPYVALNQDTGELDFNTYEPDVPTMGIWGDDGEGNYTFQITETDQSYWGETYIGTIVAIEYASTTEPAEIVLTPGADAGSWVMKIHQENGSDTPEQTFEEGTDYLWDDSGFMVDSGDSDSTLFIYWDGSGEFTFNSGSSVHPLSIITSDPPYPSEEEPGE